MLWRYNLLDPLGGYPPTIANVEVSGLSFHRAKGLEADYTILLDVSEGDYGVPSRIEDDELLRPCGGKTAVLCRADARQPGRLYDQQQPPTIPLYR